ncbi:unnamed protein product, partial [Allacma fusca]
MEKFGCQSKSLDLEESIPPVSWIILGAILFLYLKKPDRKKSNLRNFPGPYQYPILGCALEFNIPNEEYTTLAQKYLDTYGPRYVAKIGPVNMVILAGAEDVE